MKFDVLCPEGQMCDYPFEKPCRTNMPSDFKFKGSRCNFDAFFART